MNWHARLTLTLAILVLGSLTAAASAQAAFDAHGSVRQVYATGLAAKAKVSLLNSRGKTVQRKRATSLGGVLFRGVKPGSGYKVHGGGQTSGPITVLTTRSAPPTTDVYNQDIPSSGYGY